MAALRALAGNALRREALLLGLIALAAVVSALTFEGAVHPERVHDPRHRARFAGDCRALPALGAVRVRGPRPPDSLGRWAGTTAEVTGPFRRARYLRAPPAAVADAARALERGETPEPPPMPDLARYFEDARGPYTGDLVLAEGLTSTDVRAALPSAELSGEPLAREAEERESRALARALIAGVTGVAAWLAWRCGRVEAERRLLACMATLSAAGLLGVGVDRWTVAALLLVAGAPAGAPLLAAAPCLLFPQLALKRLGLVLCLGGALRVLLRRPVLPPPPERRRAITAAVAAVAAGVAGYLLLDLVPLRDFPRPEVEAEASALFVPPREAAEAAGRLEAEGIDVVGEEPLLPPAPDPATRRNLWRIYTRAQTLASRVEGEERARLEDVSDAAAQMSLTTLPRGLRDRLRTRDGRAVLLAFSPSDRPELTSARLYRARGERDLRSDARLAGVLVAVAWALAAAVLKGAIRPLLLRLAGAMAAGALLFLVAPAEADVCLPLLLVAAAAPALGAALALGAAALFLPALLLPAAALALAGFASFPRWTRGS